MTNLSIQPLWLTHFIEILLVPEFKLTKFIVGAFSYKAHFRPQIFSTGKINILCDEYGSILEEPLIHLGIWIRDDDIRGNLRSKMGFLRKIIK